MDTTKKTKRKSQFSSTMPPTKYKKSKPIQSENHIEKVPAYSLPTDTESCINMLIVRYKMHQEFICPIPVLFVHQIYTVLRDRTMVDQELQTLRKSFTIRVIRVTSGPQEMLVATERDYRKYVLGMATKQTDTVFNHAFRIFADEVLKEFNDLFITREDLESFLGQIEDIGKDKKPTMDDIIAELSTSGLLIRKLDTMDVDAYWFSIPNIGTFMRQVDATRKSLVNIVKRSQYKQILTSKLEKRKCIAKGCTLPFNFILSDCIGSARIVALDTHLGERTMIKLGTATS